MSPADVLGNLLAFAAQLAVLVAAAGALERVLPVDRPQARLAYWQAVLALGLLLPLVQPWRVVSVSVVETPSPWTTSAPPHGAFEDDGARLGGGREIRPIPPSSVPAVVRDLGLAHLLIGVLALGIGVAALRLVGAARALRRVRLRSRPLPPALAVSGEDLRLSREIASPVTFGWRRPVILLPHAFTTLRADEQRGVVCHERVHVERRHWMAHLLEELLRVALWFHPALHWMLGRLRLAREQAVDAEVVRRMGDRASYLEALVSLASARRADRRVPAASFFTRSHLAERVDLLLKEEPMSRSRVVVSLASSAAALAVCAAAAVAVMPLHAAAPVPPAAPAAPAPPAPVMPLDEVDEVAPVPPVAAVEPAPPVPAVPAGAGPRMLRTLPPLPMLTADETDDEGRREVDGRRAELEALRRQVAQERAAYEEMRKAMEQMREQLQQQAAQMKQQFEHGFERDFGPKMRDEMARARAELETASKDIERAAREAALEAQKAHRDFKLAEPQMRQEMARAQAELERARGDIEKAVREAAREAQQAMRHVDHDARREQAKAAGAAARAQADEGRRHAHEQEVRALREKVRDYEKRMRQAEARAREWEERAKAKERAKEKGE